MQPFTRLSRATPYSSSGRKLCRRERERGKDIVFVEMIQPVLLSFCFVVDNGQIQEHKLHNICIETLQMPND